MRRWVLIIMLLVYPFQVALAVADGCCVATPAGISHHGAVSDKGVAVPAAVAPFPVDEARPALADPHCAACVFGQIAGFPVSVAAVPAVAHRVAATSASFPLLPSIPRSRPERPNWPASAT